MIVNHASTRPRIGCIGKSSHRNQISMKEIKREKNSLKKSHLTFLEHKKAKDVFHIICSSA